MKCKMGLLIAICGLLAIGCKKDEPISPIIPPPAKEPPKSKSPHDTTFSDTTLYDMPFSDTMMHAYAGENIMLELPLKETGLYGNYWWNGGPQKFTISTINWVKVSGPTSIVIENKNALMTKVSGLEKGVYQFEFSITNTFGVTAKDTVAIIVGQLSSNPKEIIFKDLSWNFDLVYNTIEVKDFNLLVPSGAFFKVYVQKDKDSMWIEVKPVSLDTTVLDYEYFIEGRPSRAGGYTFGSLYIFYYKGDVSDSPSVKIVY
jgi:hypothetical protein